MTLQAGTPLGPYVIVAPLGAGGMGEVYRARDTRLDREVAVKIVPEHLAHDPATRARFEREARAVAALSDPNILAIFDVGSAGETTYAVMELLDGNTLRTRLADGPLPTADAAAIAAAIADGLAAAHSRGIVHRDIKPENVFLTRRGAVKILDFGLAQTSGAPSAAETVATLTVPGTLLGTVGYMAPEQVEGIAVDARSDLFALGCVLYELLTGRRAFAQPTSAETLTAILRQEPAPLDEAAARPVPSGLSAIVRRCLAKSPDDRFQSARDLAFALRTFAAADLAPAPPSVRVATPGLAWWFRAAMLLVPLAVAAVWFVLRTTPAASEAGAPPSAITLPVEGGRPFAPVLSPDGKYVAYLQDSGERVDLWIRSLAGGPPSNLTARSGLVIQSKSLIGGPDISPDGSLIAFRASTEESPRGGIFVVPAPLGGAPRKLVPLASSLRWSPDGSRIAYIRAGLSAGDSLLTARADGSEERVLVPAAGGIHVHQAAWSHDAAYVYFARSIEVDNTAPTEIWRVPAGGGNAEPVVTTEGMAVGPAPLPDGHGLVYAGDRPGEGLNLWLKPFDGGPERRLTTGAGAFLEPRASRDGLRVVCTAQRALESLAIVDATGTDQTGPFPLLTGLGVGDSEPTRGRGQASVVFRSLRTGWQNLWRVEAGGITQQVTVGPAGDHHPSMSPDGRQVAFVSARGGKRAIWVAPVDGGAPRPLVEGNVLDQISWSPDGTRIVYAMADGPEPSLWIAPVAGGAASRVPGVNGALPAWSPAADMIAYVARRGGLRFTTSRGEPIQVAVDIQETLANRFTWSDDGKMLALTSAPGWNRGEVWLIEMGPPVRTRRVALLPSRFTVNGVAWRADNRSLIVGLVEHEDQILLLDGVR